MNREILEKPFMPEQIKRRQGTDGDVFDYVEGCAVIQRLNECFEAEWIFEIQDHRVYDEEVVVLGKLTAQGVAKSQFGKSRITRAKKDNSIISLGDDLKAAATDCLKKCATLFGVGLHLYFGVPPAGNGNGHSNGNGNGNGNGAHHSSGAVGKAPLRCSKTVTDNLMTALMAANIPCDWVVGITSARIATTRDGRLNLAKSGAAVVDMETYPIVSVAAGIGIPVVVLRVVSDSIDRELPDFNSALNEAGGLDGRKALKVALGSPLKTLKLLAANKRAMHRLAPALGVVLTAQL